VGVKVLTEPQKWILKKLIDNNYIGARHTSEDNIPKGYPKHQRGNIKTELKELTKQNLLYKHPTAYGWEYAINPTRIPEILAQLEP